jgi:threonine dehydratase
VTSVDEAPPRRPRPDDALSAQEYLRDLVVRTPALSSMALDERAGCRLVAKAECLQVTGSFKVRGALNRVRLLPAEERARGLLTVSAGNAALGLAYAGHALGAGVTVVMPENAVPAKTDGVRALGGTVVQDGVTDAAGAFRRAAELQDQHGYTFVHPFDDPYVVAGAATATLELLEQEPGVERLVVPCSGGGLISGAILAAQTAGRAGDIEIIGVQPDLVPTVVRSLEAGQPVEVDHPPTLADGLTAPRPGRLNFGMIRSAGIQVVTVSETAIRAAVRDLVTTLKIVPEPSAAVGLAAIMAKKIGVTGGVTALLLSGGNIAPAVLADCVTTVG